MSSFKSTLTKRSTPELKKLLREQAKAKEKWQDVRRHAVGRYGKNSPVIKGIDNAINLHNERSYDIFDVITSRMGKPKRKVVRK
jgi:hypothetical protein